MTKNNKHFWTREELEDIFNLHEQGYENTTIAEKYHCHHSTICKLIRGKDKKDKIDFEFKKTYGEFPTLNEKNQFIQTYIRPRDGLYSRIGAE